ncbi:MAG: DUF2905 domain-containing protein [Vitreoscilla sp.]
MRFFLILLLSLLIFNRFGDWLSRHGFGRLPGDIRVRIGGRELFVPLGSGVALLLAATVIAWL